MNHESFLVTLIQIQYDTYSAAEIWSPNVTHESTGRPKVSPPMVHLATNELFRFYRKYFRMKLGVTFTDIMCPFVLVPQVALGFRLPLLTILIDFMLWADYWLMDHPELRRTTQPSNMGGPLCDPRFCIFRSNVHICHFFNIFRFSNGNLRKIEYIIQKRYISLPIFLYHATYLEDYHDIYRDTRCIVSPLTIGEVVRD